MINGKVNRGCTEQVADGKHAVNALSFACYVSVPSYSRAAWLSRLWVRYHSLNMNVNDWWNKPVYQTKYTGLPVPAAEASAQFSTSSPICLSEWRRRNFLAVKDKRGECKTQTRRKTSGWLNQRTRHNRLLLQEKKMNT